MAYTYEDYNVLGGVRHAIAKKYIKDAKKILDVGCGDGYFAFALGEASPKTKVLGIDVNPTYISIAESVKNVENVHFQTKNFYAVEERYDLITTFLALANILYPAVDLVNFFKQCQRLSSKIVLCEEFPERAQNDEQRLGFRLFEEFDYRFIPLDQLIQTANASGYSVENIQDYPTGAETLECESIKDFLLDEIEMFELDRKKRMRLSNLMRKYNNFQGKKVQIDALITVIELNHSRKGK